MSIISVERPSTDVINEMDSIPALLPCFLFKGNSRTLYWSSKHFSFLQGPWGNLLVTTAGTPKAPWGCHLHTEDLDCKSIFTALAFEKWLQLSGFDNYYIHCSWDLQKGPSLNSTQLPLNGCINSFRFLWKYQPTSIKLNLKHTVTDKVPCRKIGCLMVFFLLHCLPCSGSLKRKDSMTR